LATTVVVGAQWGDEAKGKVVDVLSRDADVVVRYGGGSNAGHTVAFGGETFKLHLIPSGIFNPKTTCVISDGVVADPEVITREIKELSNRGVRVDNLKISGNAHVILPYHRLQDQLEENFRGGGKIGTTVQGIGPAYQDKVARIGIRMYDLIDPEFFEKRLAANLEIKNKLLTQVYGAEPLDLQAILDTYLGYADQIRRYVAETSSIVSAAVTAGKKVVFEGAQGTMLDIDYGTYPFVTSSHPVAGGACLGTGVGPTQIDQVIGVAKAYTTRVGAGVFPTEQANEIGDRIRERGHEYGTTTGRPRRCGWLDLVALRYAVRINGMSGLAMMLLDVLSGFETVKFCTAYEHRGRILTEYPGDQKVLAECQPVYEELPGWAEEITGCRSFFELTEQARRYVPRVSELFWIPVVIISVGPERDQTIFPPAEAIGSGGMQGTLNIG